jgi:hypothetical protein
MEEHVRSEVSANREADVENAQSTTNTATVEDSMDGPTRGAAEQAVRIGDPIDEEFPVEAAGGTIDNAASDANSGLRRSGGTPHDPHGGHEHLGAERRAPDPNPVQELAPGGQGAESPPYSADDIENRLAAIARRQPESGPSETDRPTLGPGNPLIGAHPADLARAVNPTSDIARQREGMHETGGPNWVDNTDLVGSSPDEPAGTLAYTGSQKPNLPPIDLRDPDMPDNVQGSGRLEEPVERRQNSLVFDPDTENFEVKQEMHETGVSSQKGDALA